MTFRAYCLSETGFGLVSMVLRKPKIVSSKPKPVSMILENGHFQKCLLTGPGVPQSNDATYLMGKKQPL